MNKEEAPKKRGYRKGQNKVLTEEGVYIKKTKEDGYKFFNKGYYVKGEILLFLHSNEPIRHHHKGATEFGKMFDEVRATVANQCKEGRYIYLDQGYYKVKTFIDYLIREIS